MDRIFGCLTDMIHKFSGDIKHHERFFVETDKCVSCGICKKVCPIDNITLEKGRPVIHSECIRCGACTHNCPKNAIRYKGEKSSSKYRNANVSLSEIIDANS